jgi:hypothetical protein
MGHIVWRDFLGSSVHHGTGEDGSFQVGRHAKGVTCHPVSSDFQIWKKNFKEKEI